MHIYLYGSIWLNNNVKKFYTVSIYKLNLLNIYVKSFYIDNTSKLIL